MHFPNRTCSEFTRELASSAPVPGGGGASALVGAIGTALGGMVASLTIGKKKYAGVEEEIRALQQTCLALQDELLDLIDRDAQGFAPLAAAYSLPSATPEEKAHKAAVLEEESVKACEVPLQIMARCCEAIEAMEVFAEKGSRLAVSDAGVGALLCKAALEGASLNVFINTKALRDRETAAALNRKANDMLAAYGARAQAVYTKVADSLKEQE